MLQAEPFAPIDGDRLCVALAGQRIGQRVVILEETTSTNDVIAQMAGTSAEGLVVIAETQTAARGQYGRRWESAARRGLWLSVLLRPRIAVQESARLTSLLAEAIVATIAKQCGLQCSIKPPNDIYLDGRKLAGVLVEMRVETDGEYAAIAGVGMNINHMREDFPAELRAIAGSIAMAIGHTIDRTEMAVEFLRELNRRYEAFGVRPNETTRAALPAS